MIHQKENQTQLLKTVKSSVRSWENHQTSLDFG